MMIHSPAQVRMYQIRFTLCIMTVCYAGPSQKYLLKSLWFLPSLHRNKLGVKFLITYYSQISVFISILYFSVNYFCDNSERQFSVPSTPDTKENEQADILHVCSASMVRIRTISPKLSQKCP